MRLAIASGKGGTGKTTLAVSLAMVAPRPVQLLDCDVEVPNCQLFLNLDLRHKWPVTVRHPEVDSSRCDLCGKCSRICAFHAIVMVRDRVIVHPELCHGCGGCAQVCSSGAIREVDRPIGAVEVRGHDDLTLVQGKLHVGEPWMEPVIEAVRAHEQVTSKLVLVDAPPGAACPAVAAIRDCDYVLLVTEPTPFGLHDLQVCVELVDELGIPCGVVINKAGSGDQAIQRYCSERGIPVLLEIPYLRALAEAYSTGHITVNTMPRLRRSVARLLNTIMDAHRCTL